MNNSITKKVHYDFFVSGKWRNRDNVLNLIHKIREKGYSVYSFSESAPTTDKKHSDPEEFMQHFEKLDIKNDPYVKKIFNQDMEAEKNCDTFILLLPAGKSCHIEAGIAYSLGKKCILIGEQKEAESLYLIFAETYSNIEDFLKTI